MNPRVESPFAASPGAPSAALPAVVGGAVDGLADEWRGATPFAQLRGRGSQRAEVWLGARGTSLRFAARVEGAEAASRAHASRCGSRSRG